MQARFYAPWFGRFLSPDPARDQHFEITQSWNIYSYVQNDPTMKIDPTGMLFDDPKKMNAGNWVKTFLQEKESIPTKKDASGEVKAVMYDDNPKKLEKSNATIGWGHLIHRGKVGLDTPQAKEAEKPFKDGVSIAKAKEIFNEDLDNKASRFVKSYVKVDISQEVFDSLTSFCYNVGSGNFQNSDTLKKINDLDLKGAADALEKHSDNLKADSPGLPKRRKEEADHLRTGTIKKLESAKKDEKK